MTSVRITYYSTSLARLETNYARHTKLLPHCHVKYDLSIKKTAEDITKYLYRIVCIRFSEYPYSGPHPDSHPIVLAGPRRATCVASSQRFEHILLGEQGHVLGKKFPTRFVDQATSVVRRLLSIICQSLDDQRE